MAKSNIGDIVFQQEGMQFINRVYYVPGCARQNRCCRDLLNLYTPEQAKFKIDYFIERIKRNAESTNSVAPSASDLRRMIQSAIAQASSSCMTSMPAPSNPPRK